MTLNYRLGLLGFLRTGLQVMRVLITDNDQTVETQLEPNLYNFAAFNDIRSFLLKVEMSIKVESNTVYKK